MHHQKQNKRLHVINVPQICVSSGRLRIMAGDLSDFDEEAVTGKPTLAGCPRTRRLQTDQKELLCHSAMRSISRTLGIMAQRPHLWSVAVPSEELVLEMAQSVLVICWGFVCFVCLHFFCFPHLFPCYYQFLGGTSPSLHIVLVRLYIKVPE